MDITERSVRFDSYVGKLAAVIGHADRHVPMTSYCTALMLPGERKSVEPMAAMLDPARTDAKRQSMLHFVGQSEWSDEAVLGVVRREVLPVVQSHGPIEAWVLDDTGIPKKGKHSVGVKNQYCGVLGKNANCQVAVSLSVANQDASLPVGYRLYLPEDWANDKERRRRAIASSDKRASGWRQGPHPARSAGRPSPARAGEGLEIIPLYRAAGEGSAGRPGVRASWPPALQDLAIALPTTRRRSRLRNSTLPVTTCRP
jgi:hypothetical protein